MAIFGGRDDEKDTKRIEVHADANIKKKGTRPSWQPAPKVAKIEAPNNGRPRWCDPNPANIQKKQAEGWQFLNKTTSPGTFKDTNGMNKDIHSNSGLGSEIVNREMVAMFLPEELALARDEYHREKTMRRTKRAILMEDAKKTLSNSGVGGSITPKIVID